MGAHKAAQTGKPGIKDSGNAKSCAPLDAACPIAVMALAVVAVLSKKTGERWAEATVVLLGKMLTPLGIDLVLYWKGGLLDALKTTKIGSFLRFLHILYKYTVY
jgi:hypothetical protein